jgi:hypothetical protein
MKFPLHCGYIFELRSVCDNGSFIPSQETTVTSKEEGEIRPAGSHEYGSRIELLSALACACHRRAQFFESSFSLRRTAAGQIPEELEKFPLDGVCNCLQAIMGVELLIDVVQVISQRLQRDFEFARNLC